jgi:hypothetical protein
LASRTKLSALRGPNIDEIVSNVRMRLEDKERTSDRWKRRTDEGFHGWQYIQEIVLPVAKAAARDPRLPDLESRMIAARYFMRHYPDVIMAALYKLAESAVRHAMELKGMRITVAPPAPAAPAV